MLQIDIKKNRVRLSKSARKSRNRPPIVTTEAVVRVGQPNDLEKIMDLVATMQDEVGVFPINPDRVRSFMIAPLHLDGGIVGIIENNGVIEAGILLRVCDAWYTDQQHLEEFGLFVHRDFRYAKDSRAKKLVEFAKKTAESLSLPLMIGVLSKDRTDAKITLYERIFGQPVGAFFFYSDHLEAKQE